MLHDSGLPSISWAEAYNTATYLHNRTPTRAFGGRTPYEVLYGVKRETGRFAFARIRSAVCHCQSDHVFLWFTSIKEAVIGFGTRKDGLSLNPKTLFFF